MLYYIYYIYLTALFYWVKMMKSLSVQKTIENVPFTKCHIPNVWGAKVDNISSTVVTLAVTLRVATSTDTSLTHWKTLLSNWRHLIKNDLAYRSGKFIYNIG